MVDHPAHERQSPFRPDTLERKLDPLPDLEPLGHGPTHAGPAPLARGRLQQAPVLRVAYRDAHPDAGERVPARLAALHVLPDDPVLAGRLCAVERGVGLTEQVAEL